MSRPTGAELAPVEDDLGNRLEGPLGMPRAHRARGTPRSAGPTHAAEREVRGERPAFGIEAGFLADASTAAASRSIAPPLSTASQRTRGRPQPGKAPDEPGPAFTGSAERATWPSRAARRSSRSGAAFPRNRRVRCELAAFTQATSEPSSRHSSIFRAMDPRRSAGHGSATNARTGRWRPRPADTVTPRGRRTSRRSARTRPRDRCR